MSTDRKADATKVTPVGPPLSLRELGALLVKHYGLHEGIFDVMVEYQIGVGAVGPDKDSRVPGAMIGAHRVGLVPAKEAGSNTVNAGDVNPRKTRRRQKAEA